MKSITIDELERMNPETITVIDIRKEENTSPSSEKEDFFLYIFTKEKEKKNNYKIQLQQILMVGIYSQEEILCINIL